MGLCKCPKKKVTNLFCYEHRVNVCDYCMTENHPKVIVLFSPPQSYLLDLQYISSLVHCSVLFSMATG